MTGQRKIGVGTFESTPYMRRLVDNVLASGRLSYGPMCRESERLFARIHGSRFAVWANSGTDALRVALAALRIDEGWDDGDEIIVPAVTFVASVNAVLQNGLTPVLADVDPTRYNVDPGQVEAAITNRTRAIMPVHLFGQPAEMDRLVDVAHRYGLKIVEDSCEAMFVKYDGIPVGAWGDVAAFSTYVAHLITTGVGGFAVTKRPEYAGLIRSLVNHGRSGCYVTIDDDDGLRGEALREVMTKRFSFEHVGWSARITEMEAAIALSQLEPETPLEDPWYIGMMRKRRVNVAAFYEAAKHARVHDWLQLPATYPKAEHGWMMLPLVLRDPGPDTTRKTDLTQFLEERGIETREMLPLTNQPVYTELFDEAAYPIARWINRGGFYVGCHQGLDADDMGYIAETLAAWRERDARISA